MHILVVDDTPDIVDLMKTMLESGGYEVTGAQGGKECLDLLGKEAFDIILLDVTMPEVSGLDVVKELHESGNLEKNNVILFTAASISDDEIEKWRQLGVKDCLRKPFDPGALFEAVSNVSTQE